MTHHTHIVDESAMVKSTPVSHAGLSEFMANAAPADTSASDDPLIEITFSPDNFEREFDGEHTNEVDCWPERERENDTPKALRVSDSDYSNILSMCFDSDKAFEHAAKEYVSSYNSVLKSELSFNPRITHKGITYSRYHGQNIIQAAIPLSTIRELIWISLGHDQHATFFNNINECGDDPREVFKTLPGDWDTDVIQALICACVKLIGDCDDIDFSIYESMSDSSDFYQAYHEGLDYAKVESMVEAKRAELLEEIKESEPELVADNLHLVFPTFFPHPQQYVFSFYKLTFSELGINT